MKAEMSGENDFSWGAFARIWRNGMQKFYSCEINTFHFAEKKILLSYNFGSDFSSLKNVEIHLMNPSGLSPTTEWPAFGTTSREELDMEPANRMALSWSKTSLFSPRINRVGTLIREERSRIIWGGSRFPKMATSAIFGSVFQTHFPSSRFLSWWRRLSAIFSLGRLVLWLASASTASSKDSLQKRIC